MDPTQQRLLTTAEVAKLFGVHTDTVTRWDKKGVLRSVRTPGGRRRFFRQDFAYALDPGNPSQKPPHPKQ